MTTGYIKDEAFKDEPFAIAYDEQGNEIWRSPFNTGPATPDNITAIAAGLDKVREAWRVVTTTGVVLKDRGKPMATMTLHRSEETGWDKEYTVTPGYVIKDSGEREEVPGTGMLRDIRTGKGRYDLLPPDAMRRLAQHYETGAEKYGPHNWEKGGPLSRYLDSLLRHAFAVVAGQTDEDHVIAVAWNALAIADHQEKIKRGELPADLDDVFTR